jgi:hypothetical protein
MTQIQQSIATTSSSSSNPSGLTGNQQNQQFYDIASQLADYLHLNNFADTLSRLSNQLAILKQKVDLKFGETEKLISLENLQDSKKKHNLATTSTSTSNSTKIMFPKFYSKDSENLKNKITDKISRELKVRRSISPTREYLGKLSSSSSSSRSSSAPHRKSNIELLNDLDKVVLKQLGMHNADLFYHKIDPEFKENLDKLIHSHSSIFAEKELVPPIHNKKGDITGYMMQKNAQSFAALAEIFYKYAVNNDIDGIKHFSVIQVQEAAKLGTQGSIHRIYKRDQEMAKALSMSNAATLITPTMKDNLQIYKSNNIFSNYKK